MGYHRDTFYEVRRAFQVGGVAALVEQRRGPRRPHPNRVSEEVETKILAYALDHPTHGAQRVANELRLQGVNVGVSGVRGVWSRHDLETRLKRLLRLERHAQETAFVVSDEQLRLLERHSVEFRCRHVEATKPGELQREVGPVRVAAQVLTSRIRGAKALRRSRSRASSAASIVKSR